MKRLLRIAGACGFYLLCASAAAQAPAPAAQPMPQGHPTVSGEAPKDISTPDASLPPGTVAATIVDAQGAVVPNARVRLGIMFNKIAEGQSRSERFETTDAHGDVRFSGLSTSSDYTYRVTLPHGLATYATAPFPLGTNAGWRVVLHAYPVVQRLEDAPVGMRGFVYVETRDDLFQFEVLFRVFNFGTVTWVPKDAYVRLPDGWKAFKATESMSDVGFEADDAARGARFKGTFSPGQHDVSFRFQVPKENQETAQFRVGLPLRVAEIRVLAEASSSMGLSVEGFEQPQVGANTNGQRVLVTRRLSNDTGETQRDFTIALSGLPVPGTGRWVAVLLAFGLALTGVGVASGVIPDGESKRRSRNDDRRKARELLLEELVALEQTKRAERIGPRAYEQARRSLVDALARLGLEPSQAASPQSKSKTRRRRAAHDRA